MKLNKDQKIFLLVWIPICLFIFMQLGSMIGTYYPIGGEFIYDKEGTLIGCTGYTPGIEMLIGPSLICIFLTVLVLQGLGENNKAHTKKKEKGLQNA